MSKVVIGMDPHKRSATIEIMASDETVLGVGRYATAAAGYRAMFAAARRWPERTWAIEGCQGIGGHIASRLLADGEQVVDVPPKLSARARVFATGQGRKTDATDAHSVALVATRMNGLRPVADDHQLAVLRILADRRRSLGEDHTRMISQPHRLLLELIPGGAKKDLSAAQARVILASVRATRCRGQGTAPGRRRAHRRPATHLPAQESGRQTTARPARRQRQHTHPAARHRTVRRGPLLIEVGDITRFPDRAYFASWNGTAPIDASSGEQIRHRLSRAGNRQINRALHIMAVVQLRNPTEGRAYFDRKVAAGKTPMEAIRALKPAAVRHRLIPDSRRCHHGSCDGSGRALGDDLQSSVTGLTPAAGFSDKPLPGPAAKQPRAISTKAS
jgi:transposase